MDTKILNADITTLFHLDDASEEERAGIVADIGQVVLDASLMRLATEMTDVQEEALEHYMETDPEPEVLLEHLFEHYAHFRKIFEEEMSAFKQEAMAVLNTD